jgi:hypothetical protein
MTKLRLMKSPPQAEPVTRPTLPKAVSSTSQAAHIFNLLVSLEIRAAY